jgi:hypothetical protein
MLIKALLFPAVAKVEFKSDHQSALTKMPIGSILREGWRELRRSVSELISSRFEEALHDIRLPLLIALSAVLPAILALSFKKIITFLSISMEHDPQLAFEWFLNVSDRHYIFGGLVLLYLSQIFIWNSKLDTELSETFDGPQAGSIESLLLAKIQKENGMRRGLKLPAKEQIPALSARIDCEARAAGLTVREYHRRKWLEQNGVRFEGDVEMLPEARKRI